MSKFTGPLKVAFSDARYALLIEDLVWEVGHLGSGEFIVVPQGFHSDGASVPRIFWWLMPPWGDKGTRAAILHDYMLEQIEHDRGSLEYCRARHFADRQFYEALLALGVAKWRARLCYLAVRIWALVSK